MFQSADFGQMHIARLDNLELRTFAVFQCGVIRSFPEFFPHIGQSALGSPFACPFYKLPLLFITPYLKHHNNYRSTTPSFFVPSVFTTMGWSKWTRRR